MEKSQFGVIGLAVMGENLALNIEEKGFSIAVYNRSTDKVDSFLKDNAGKKVQGAHSFEELADKLTRPRRMVMMVKAGAPVDATIEGLLPVLEPGDVLIDGGNEFYTNTERRAKVMAERGINFVGMGVSGGEEGARHGPSLMPGGPRDAYEKIQDVVTKIAAQVADGPCVTYIGPGGAGHYVKMVHNGIEYGDMQLIAEVYDVLRNVGGLSNQELADVFGEWNRAELESFLIEITAKIFAKKDPDTGKELVDVILDEASMKGTGKWTVQEGAELGSPIPTIAAAVDARVISAGRALRQEGAKRLAGPTPSSGKVDKKQLIADARAAMYAAKACSYAQGMALLQTASETRSWGLNLGEIARIWKGGCIIRAAFLGRIQEAFGAKEGAPKNLLFAPYFREAMASRQDGWRRFATLAIQHGIALPALGSALAYHDGIRRERTPANLIQAQRDFFGAHTYKRLDKEGSFHTEWSAS